MWKEQACWMMDMTDKLTMRLHLHLGAGIHVLSVAIVAYSYDSDSTLEVLAELIDVNLD